jgi:hypothetical protein
VQVEAQFFQERYLAARMGQEPAVGGQRIERAEEAETLDQFAHERIHGHHPFGLEFAERNVNGPLILAGGVEAIEGKIGRFADAHAGVTKQQENIATEIIAALQFFLKQLIL